MNQHRDTHESLEARLRSDARAMRATPPEGMEQRISAAVWREREAGQLIPMPTARRRTFRLLPPALAGLVTSACAVALVVTWHIRTEAQRTREDISFLVETVQALPARIASTDLPVTGTINVAAPLTREIESVRADARSALDFLAANFLPSSLVDAASVPAADTTRET